MSTQTPRFADMLAGAGTVGEKEASKILQFVDVIYKLSGKFRAAP